MKTANVQDETVLAGLGYKQEFKRAFRSWEVFGIAFSIIGLLPSMASTLVFALPNGGPVSLVWGWAICSIFVSTIAFALSELASAAPTSGGLYFWTFKYSSPRWRNLTSWVVGYCNTMGNIAGVSSIVWGCAVQLLAAVSIGSNMTYSATTPQIFGVFAALLALTAVVASTATRLLARLQGVYSALNLLLCAAIIIALPSATPKEFRNSAKYALGGYENLTNWPNGFAFIMGFLAPLWTLGGFDGPIHISEEVSNAGTAVPWAIMISTWLAGVLGWGINVAIAFNMGTDIEGILASPIDQPMATVFFNSFGTRPTLVIWSFVVAVQFMMGTSALVSCSRQTFAFARDGGLPFSRQLYTLNSYTRTPIACVWASSALALALGVISFAGPAASSAIFSLGVVGQYVAFGVPVVCRLMAGRAWRAGPFSLGVFGAPISTLAVLWMLFSITVVMFPANPNPDTDTMNYTVAVGGAWILLCLGYYFCPVYGGRYWFKGPIANIEIDTDGESRDTKSQGGKTSVEVTEKVVERE